MWVVSMTYQGECHTMTIDELLGYVIKVHRRRGWDGWFGTCERLGIVDMPIERSAKIEAGDGYGPVAVKTIRTAKAVMLRLVVKQLSRLTHVVTKQIKDYVDES